MPFANPRPPGRRPSWRPSLLAPQVWRRAACYGFPAGLLQAALNQGDYWMSGEVTPLVAVKSVVSPLVGFGVAYVAAVTTHYESRRPPGRPTAFAPIAPGTPHGVS